MHSWQLKNLSAWHSWHLLSSSSIWTLHFQKNCLLKISKKIRNIPKLTVEKSPFIKFCLMFTRACSVPFNHKEINSEKSGSFVFLEIFNYYFYDERTHSFLCPTLHRTELGNTVSCTEKHFLYMQVPALQGKSQLLIPFLGIARPQSQFPHSCVCVCEQFI